MRYSAKDWMGKRRLGFTALKKVAFLWVWDNTQDILIVIARITYGKCDRYEPEPSSCEDQRLAFFWRS